MSFWDFVSANWWKIGGVAVGYVALTGRNPATMIPDLPVWWEMAAMAGVAAVVVGSMASGRIDSLLPDPPKVYVVEVNARNEPPIKVHKVTPDKWANTEVVHGSVLPVGPSPEQVYLCYEYNPRQDVAVGTWLESKNEAEFVGHHQASDALEAIGEVRDHLEPMARRGQRIRQYLPR